MALGITPEMRRGDAVNRDGAEVRTEILHLNSPPGCSSTEFEHPESALS